MKLIHRMIAYVGIAILKLLVSAGLVINNREIAEIDTLISEYAKKTGGKHGQEKEAKETI